MNKVKYNNGKATRIKKKNWTPNEGETKLNTDDQGKDNYNQLPKAL